MARTVFKYLPAKYAIEAVISKRLKVSRPNQLNDLFEFQGVALDNAHARHAFGALRDQLSDVTAIASFSRSKQDVLLWAHYADSNRGICLGFEVFDHVECYSVHYLRERMQLKSILYGGTQVRINAMKKLIAAKSFHWKYEREKRIFVDAQKCLRSGGHIFWPYSESLRISHVILGPDCRISRKQIASALGSATSGVVTYRTRAAFKTFSIVRNRNESLWE